MTTDQIRLIVAIVVFVFGLAGSAVAGWTINGWRKDAEISALQKSQAEASEKDATAARQRLEAAQARGDELVRQLAATDQARAAQQQENERAIKKITTDRPCLNAATVRLLNGDGQGIKPGGVSQTASQSADADGAFATDTDVSIWADNARKKFDACRDRIDALRAFHQGSWND